jgi:hypothetical protein
MEAELLQLRRDVEELRRENAEMKETIEQNKKIIKKHETKIDELNDKVLLQLPLVNIGAAIRRRWVEQVKDMLGIGELWKAIVVKGNEAAYHADEFADATMWRLGYIKDSELYSPLDGTEEHCMQNFKSAFLKVYGKEVDRFARGIPYGEQPKQIPSVVELENIEATFRLYTFSHTQTTTVTENEHHIRYRLLCTRYSIERWKLVNEHGSSKQTWPIIDTSPVIVAIITEIEGNSECHFSNQKKQFEGEDYVRGG